MLSVGRFFFAILAFLIPHSAQSAVIYSGIQNISISQDLAGIYLNVVTGATAASEPGNWNTSASINPFFGGVSIGNSALLRPNTDGAGRSLKVAIGAVIDSSRTYAAGEAGSTTHVGAGSDQFQLNAQGLLAFVMQSTVGGPLRYGWMRLLIDNTSAGTIVDWAYDDSASNIVAGFTGTALVPEPTRALLASFSLLALLLRRRR